MLMKTTGLPADAAVPECDARDGPSSSLPQRSIAVPSGPGWSGSLRRLLSFAGPGFMVAVGYMDPGNWATSIAGGSRYGHALLCVVVASSVMAMLFQAAAVRLGLATGQDLAQACRARFPKAVNVALWVMCEVAIVACNLAEVLGMAIGLNLLFGIPLFAGVCITVVDVMLVLALQSRGFRLLEAVVGALVGVIALCFVAQLVWAGPSLQAIAAGLLPSRRIVADPQMLYLAVGIVGATVMPHNLYLHSAIVQTRRHARTQHGTREAIRWATADSTLALALALFVNSAIMIVAAVAFNRPGAAPVTEIADAYRLLSPLLGVGIASAVFGVGLLASGLSASITGTLAGQVVMEGFMRIRMSAAARAFLTRLLAIGPAAAATAWYGGQGASALLVFSQVVLSLQLPFALVPLLMFTTSRKHLGRHAFGRAASALLWTFAAGVVSLNGWLLGHLWG
jgi:manganese transport protein